MVLMFQISCDPSFDCTCPSSEMWYACPLSPDPPKDAFTGTSSPVGDDIQRQTDQ